jgi:2-phospho-L-lactate guanylyltransferase
MLQMFRGVISAALEADIGPVAVVTSEPLAAQFHDKFGLDVLSDGGLPWNDGLMHALCSIRPLPSAVLYLAGDLPLVRAEDIVQFVAAAPPRGVAIGRAYDSGTNALLVRPADAVIPRFGHAHSSRAHAADAADRGLSARVVDIAGIALDVDTIADLRRARELDRGGREFTRASPYSDRG